MTGLLVLLGTILLFYLPFNGVEVNNWEPIAPKEKPCDKTNTLSYPVAAAVVPPLPLDILSEQSSSIIQKEATDLSASP